MIKNRKKVAALILCFVLTFSVVFAQDAETKADKTAAEKVKAIADSLTMYARYPEVNRESLYGAALMKLLEDNPEFYEKAVKAMAESIDENSDYYNAEEAQRLYERLEDEVTGIGVSVLSSDGSIIVSKAFPSSPAEKAGIISGDIIIEANGTDLRGLELDRAIQYIRGPVGTKVELKLIRSGVAEPITVSVVREKVTNESAELEIIEQDNKKIAKISLYSFTENSLESFKKSLKKAENEGINNIIIDLRNNGGGYFDQAIGIADLFLEKDDIITTEDHKISILNKVYKASGKGKKYNTVVLINGYSASSSEVLTAALKENGAAKVIGERSFGKGTVQTLARTSDSSLIKYTAAYYLTPLGNNIHKVGIYPDAVVKNSTKNVDMSKFELFKLQNKYKLGDKGAEIKQAKEMLQMMGLFIGEVNEVFDENLKTAVKNFQKAVGIFSYGELDITTQYSLYHELSRMKVEVDDQLQAAIDAF